MPSSVRKCYDDTVLLYLLNDFKSASELHQHGVNKVVEGSNDNDLEKRKSPSTIHTDQISQVSSYKYLGVWIDHLLSLKDHIEFVCKRTNIYIHFLRRLRSFGASRQILLLFFTLVFMSLTNTVTLYGTQVCPLH